MAPKGNKQKNGKKTAKPSPEKPPAFQKDVVHCSWHGPGPIYKLKPVVGYNDHCASRYRNPAYSIGARQIGEEVFADTPGPKYYVQLPKAGGFTIGLAQRGEELLESRPGPYMLPDPPRNPAFSLRWRTPLRGKVSSAGPYNLPSTLNGPSFSIIPRADNVEDCRVSPDPGPPHSADPIKPRAPAYTIGFRQTDTGVCGGPGPYNPVNLDKSPAFTLGVKHNPCLKPYITKCDEAC